MTFGDDHERLIRGAVNGDRVALKVLLTESRPRLRRRLEGRIPSDLRAVIGVEDLLQEVHLEVFRRIEAFEPQGADAFDRWTTTIGFNALRTAVTRYRAQKRGGARHPLGATAKHIEDSTIALLDRLAAPERTPSRHLARSEALALMQSALNDIPGHYRDAIHRVHIEGRPVRTVAEEMGRTERAIHGLCRRGMKLLRERLQGLHPYLSSTG